MQGMHANSSDRRDSTVKRTFVLFILTVSLSAAHAPKNILDELRLLGYDLVDRSIDPSGWEKNSFGAVTTVRPSLGNNTDGFAYSMIVGAKSLLGTNIGSP